MGAGGCVGIRGCRFHIARASTGRRRRAPKPGRARAPAQPRAGPPPLREAARNLFFCFGGRRCGRLFLALGQWICKRAHTGLGSQSRDELRARSSTSHATGYRGPGDRPNAKWGKCTPCPSPVPSRRSCAGRSTLVRGLREAREGAAGGAPVERGAGGERGLEEGCQRGGERGARLSLGGG